MKKFIAMLLALVMVLSLVACGDKKDDAAGTDDSDKDSQDTITLDALRRPRDRSLCSGR